MTYDGSINRNDQYRYDYEAVNSKNPLDGIRIKCFMKTGVTINSTTRSGLIYKTNYKTNEIELTPQDIKINKPKDYLANCCVAAGKMYKDLQDKGMKPPICFSRGEFALFITREGNFICNEIISKRYIPELVKSNGFSFAHVRYPDGSTGFAWLPV